MGSVRFGDTNITLNLNFSLFGNNNIVSGGRSDGLAALSMLDNFLGHGATTGGYHSHGSDFALPNIGSIPSPNINLSGPPAAKGVEQIGDNQWRTAGGYVITAEGRQSAWNIKGPDGKDVTRVWGDPHVNEADGTRWDFTKDSDFVLPDGTRIEVDTNYDPKRGNGFSVTTGLNIMNGQDRVEVKGINTSKPTSTHHYDAYEYRALSLTTNPNKDTFHLAGDSENIHWMRERNGQMDGVITGKKFVNAGNHRIYDQVVDPTLMASVSPSRRPAPGTPAYTNMLYNYMNDEFAQTAGQLMGPRGLEYSLPMAYGMHAQQIQGEFVNDVQQLLFGGWPSYFGNYNSPMDSLRGLVDLLKSDNDWRHQLRFGGYAQTRLA